MLTNWFTFLLYKFLKVSLSVGLSMGLDGNVSEATLNTSAVYTHTHTHTQPQLQHQIRPRQPSRPLLPFMCSILS